MLGSVVANAALIANLVQVMMLNRVYQQQIVPKGCETKKKSKRDPEIGFSRDSNEGGEEQMRTSSTKCGNNLSSKLATRRNLSSRQKSQVGLQFATPKWRRTPREKKGEKIRRRLVLYSRWVRFSSKSKSKAKVRVRRITKVGGRGKAPRSPQMRGASSKKRQL